MEVESRLSRPVLRLLAQLSAAVATGDEPRTRTLIRELALLGDAAPRQALQEAILQTYLFAGFPAAINGFNVLQEAWPSRRGAAQNPEDYYASWREWHARGEELCAKIYGAGYGRLRAHMRELSPELDLWMVVEGYGKTLSRPGLSPEARELCAVASLAALRAERQLRAHLDGARRLGVEEDLLQEALQQETRSPASEMRMSSPSREREST
jgi:4-carboxymuconolactone decarboxylase